MEPPSPRAIHNPVPSPRTIPPVPRRSLSPEQVATTTTTAKSPSPIPYQTPTVPNFSSIQTATPSSYEEPVRDISERPPMKTPEEGDKPLTDAPLGIYSEVDTNAIVAIAGLSRDGVQHEYNVATCGRTDPNAPPPLPRNSTDYSSLERSDVKENRVPSPVNTTDASHVPLPYEDVVPTVLPTTTNTDSPKPQRDLSKKPPVPGSKPKLVKPPVPSNKPVPSKEALAVTPPKPKRTYVTNIAQPQTSDDNSSSQSPPATTSIEDKKSFKPMPLPRNRGSVDIDSIGIETGKTLAKSGSVENSDSPPKEPQDNSKYTPLPYAYVDIDIPDSPRDLSNQSAPSLATANTEPLPPPDANTAVKNDATPNKTGVAKQEGKSTGPPPVGAYRSKRRTPPPPPPAKPASQVKPVSSQTKPAPPPKPADTSKGKSSNMKKSVQVLPNPTPAKPIQKKFWPFSKKATAAPQPPAPSTSKNAGKTPPSTKRRDSVKKILFRTKRSASQEECSIEKPTAKSMVAAPVTTADEQSPRTTVEEERSDSPDLVGYDVVGIKNQGNTTSKSSPTTKVRLLCLFIVTTGLVLIVYGFLWLNVFGATNCVCTFYFHSVCACVHSLAQPTLLHRSLFD